MKNALWIEPNYEALAANERKLAEYNGRYIMIEGIYNKNNLGHLYEFSGSVQNITRFRSWP